ncbi:hypothetical protein Lal_00037350 [Lupinus albus]|nr:hypothetical protein Lal_00037350 [Lupinus albus]
MIHNAQIPSNHLKVSIDISIEDDALLSIPIDEDIVIVRRVVSTFVAWSEHLIDVVPIMGKVSADHSATSPPRIDEHASKKAKVVKSKPRSSKSNLESSAEVAPTKTNFCEKLWNYVQKLLSDSTIVISIPLPMYLYDNFITKSKKKVMFLSPHSNTLVALNNDIRKNEQA